MRIIDNALLRGKFVELNVYIRKEERFIINDVNFYHKNLGKQEQYESIINKNKGNNEEGKSMKQKMDK